VDDIVDRIDALEACAEAFSAAAAQADRAKLLERIRDLLDDLREADEKSRADLKAIHEGAAEGRPLAEAQREAILASSEKERIIAKALPVRIVSLQRYLADTSVLDDFEAHQLLQTAVNIACGYIAGYQNVRDQLIWSAAKHPTATEGVLHARPVKGKIDYAELIRDTIARFPKILAALAK
jgi:hypothetical protein